MAWSSPIAIVLPDTPRELPNAAAPGGAVIAGASVQTLFASV
jgi:hypothetical protein